MTSLGTPADLIERAVRAGQFPGAVAGWATTSGSERVVTVGTLSTAWPPAAMVSGAWFDLASLTKPLVTTTLSLLAIRHRVLELESRVGEILPAAAGHPTATLTVRHLLTHVGGLPAWVPLYGLCRGDPERALHTLVRVDPGAPPERRVVYSCVGFLILGVLLEQVFGERLERVFENLVVTPLELDTELGFHPCPEGRLLAPGAASPTVERGLAAQAGSSPDLVPPSAAGLPDDGNARFLDGVAGNAGLFGSLHGVLELAAQYLAPRSRLLTEAEITLATRNWTPGLEQDRGLGWQLASSPGCSAGPTLAPSAFGHTGFTGPSIWVDPVRGSALGLLCHRHHPAHREVDLHPLRRRFHTLALAEIP